jgi:hypothetical protein
MQYTFHNHFHNTKTAISAKPDHTISKLQAINVFRKLCDDLDCLHNCTTFHSITNGYYLSKMSNDRYEVKPVSFTL